MLSGTPDLTDRGQVPCSLLLKPVAVGERSGGRLPLLEGNLNFLLLPGRLFHEVGDSSLPLQSLPQGLTFLSQEMISWLIGVPGPADSVLDTP